MAFSPGRFSACYLGLSDIVCVLGLGFIGLFTPFVD